MIKKKLRYILPTVLVLAVAAYIIFFNNSDNEVSSINKIDKTRLIGNWIRTDSNYQLRILGVSSNGTLQAQYFNPRPINVGKANWEETYGNLKIIVELQDVNYPGSTYKLNYLPDRDMLAGEYYQAVEGQTFYIEFSRVN
jgi:hypothetical protein